MCVGLSCRLFAKPNLPLAYFQLLLVSGVHAKSPTFFHFLSVSVEFFSFDLAFNVVLLYIMKDLPVVIVSLDPILVTYLFN